MSKIIDVVLLEDKENDIKAHFLVLKDEDGVVIDKKEVSTNGNCATNALLSMIEILLNNSGSKYSKYETKLTELAQEMAEDMDIIFK